MSLSFLRPCVLAVAMAFTSINAHAAEFQVQMLNKGSNGEMWQFDPAFIKISPGDSVTFIPADKGHNSESLSDIIPSGAEPWKGKLNKPFTVTYTKDGLYVYKCLPHVGLGMVGIIQVGDSTVNLDSLRNAELPAKARERLDELVALVGG